MQFMPAQETVDKWMLMGLKYLAVITITTLAVGFYVHQMTVKEAAAKYFTTCGEDLVRAQYTLEEIAR